MELDYQMALVLQHKLDKESSRKSNGDDNALALHLQQQLNGEFEDDTDADYQLALELQKEFTYEKDLEDPGQNLVYKKNNLNTSKCLVDPSWEIIDPTPDIHNLFVAFNEKFFWNFLTSVFVEWSKKMTRCAGVCSYQGRSGNCKITLSEPLLKLRPRKDLVETLLHEMIHAYLFVTNNNKDRDGHGPEFHKHMYRINKEAGTNITVFHDFHDEVRLYQQHWWRCNGPCQYQKPFFGMVRRSMNRAPGPYDRWFAEHTRNCGGTFIKVKEPDDYKKKTDKKNDKKEVNPKTDIRNYIHTNVKTLNNNDNEVKVSKVVSNNIYGFTNLTKPGSSGLSKPGSSIKGGVKVKGNANSTIVINSKTPNRNEKKTAITTNTAKTPTKSPENAENIDYSIVRNHWLNKFIDKSKDQEKNRKRPLDKTDSLNTAKMVKYSNPNLVNCPICDKSFTDEQLNDHLDHCLEESNKDQKNVKECIICGKNVPDCEYTKHVSICVELNFSEETEPKIVDQIKPPCKICGKIVDSSVYDLHVEQCLLKIYDEIDTKYSDNNKNNKNDEKVSCLACGKEIIKSNLNLHLEDCMNETIFISDDLDDEDDVKMFNCPICVKLIDENLMQQHLDSCLNNSNEIVDEFNEL